MNMTISITEFMLLALVFLALIILVWVIYEILGNVNKKFDDTLTNTVRKFQKQGLSSRF